MPGAASPLGQLVHIKDSADREQYFCWDLWIACREVHPRAIEHSHRLSLRRAERLSEFIKVRAPQARDSFLVVRRRGLVRLVGSAGCGPAVAPDRRSCARAAAKHPIAAKRRATRMGALTRELARFVDCSTRRLLQTNTPVSKLIRPSQEHTESLQHLGWHPQKH